MPLLISRESALPIAVMRAMAIEPFFSPSFLHCIYFPLYLKIIRCVDAPGLACYNAHGMSEAR
jgi:hypothetical protein